MGRLFWKFFAAILFAQVAATIGIGGVFWLRDQAREKAAITGVDMSPPAEMLVEASTATLVHGGPDALRDMLGKMKRRSVFVIDERGNELLSRTVDRSLVLQAETILKLGDERSTVRAVTVNDGHRYLIFSPRESRSWPGGPPPEPRASFQRGEPTRHDAVPDGVSGNDGGHSRGPFHERPPGEVPRAGDPRGGGAHIEPPPGEPPHGEPSRSGGPRGDGPPPPNAAFFQMATLIAATLASLLVAFVLAWYFSRPIRALRGAFEAAAAGDLEPRFSNASGGRGDELTDLGRDFDRMSAQLRTLMDGQRRLLHDVSHELRSPLARLQAAIGLAHQQPDKLAASFERIERESVRMDKLVGELLTLSRLEAAPPAMNEDICIQELVEEIVADASFEAEQIGRRILMKGSTEANVRGAPDLLWRAIENVVRNAIKHTRDGGTVEVNILRVNGSVQLQVTDRGPGVAPSDLTAIFKPFFRAEATSNNVDGHGLGLAIALRVIEAHGGAIKAENREGGGLSVTISLPQAHRQ